jgi:hypothetical protein
MTNRKLGPVRRPGTREGLTRTQAEKRLRELMETIQVTTDPDRTVAIAGEALLAQLEARESKWAHVDRPLYLEWFVFEPDDRVGRLA